MRRVVIIVLVVFILIDAFFLVMMTKKEDFGTITPLMENEQFRVLNSELIPHENVTTFCVTDSAIVLFYDLQGLANVYSLDGSFLYGLQVKTLRNGTGDIAFEDEYLYIKTRGNRIFIFKGKELIRSFSYSEDPTEYRFIEETIETHKNNTVNEETYYYLKNANQIVKRAPHGAMVSVISMPQITSDVPMLGVFLLLLVAALAHYLRYLWYK